MLGAIKDSVASRAVSVTNLPFSCGLAIIRVEESVHPAILPVTNLLPDGRSETLPTPFLANPVSEVQTPRISGKLRAAKIKVGHILRQLGLKA
jgi:hypothetical protein